MDLSQKDRKQNKVSSQPSRGLGEKEKDVPGVGREVIEEVGKEIEPGKEIEKAGVELKKEEVKVPPSIEKLGVRAVGPAAPSPPPTISLPLTDDQVVGGLTVPLLFSLRWLAEFCLRQLKKAHIGLKRISGRIVRFKA